jgi:hypothetical protein
MNQAGIPRNRPERSKTVRFIFERNITASASIPYGVSSNVADITAEDPYCESSLARGPFA